MNHLLEIKTIGRTDRSKILHIPAAVQALQRALEIHVAEGRFTIAARTEKDVAKIHESEGNLTEVRKHY